MIIHIARRKAPRLLLQGASSSCVAFTLSAQMEAATGLEYSPHDIWRYAVDEGMADAGRGVIGGNHSQIVHHFAPDVYFIEYCAVGKRVGKINGKRLETLVPASDTRVRWFIDALKQGVLAFNLAGHSIYVYDMIRTARPKFISWIPGLSGWKNEFLAYDPQNGLVKIPVGSMSHTHVSLALAPVR